MHGLYHLKFNIEYLEYVMKIKKTFIHLWMRTDTKKLNFIAHL